MTRVFLYGRDGRMGRAIESIIDTHDDTSVCGGMSAEGLSGETSNIDVVIDFSGAEVAEEALRFSREHNAALVAGTTGLGEAYFARLDEAANEIPVLYAANMSLGVNVLRHLVRNAASMLPESFDIEIVELHHKKKRDSPSGTALALLEEANRGRAREAREGMVVSREGMVGERREGEIGVFGVRGGNVAGEHTVYFFGENERIELTHRATDRDIFARGAVESARWIAGRKPGRYTIEHVLGLEG